MTTLAGILIPNALYILSGELFDQRELIVGPNVNASVCPWWEGHTDAVTFGTTINSLWSDNSPDKIYSALGINMPAKVGIN